MLQSTCTRLCSNAESLVGVHCTVQMDVVPFPMRPATWLPTTITVNWGCSHATVPWEAWRHILQRLVMPWCHNQKS